MEEFQPYSRSQRSARLSGTRNKSDGAISKVGVRNRDESCRVESVCRCTKLSLMVSRGWSSIGQGTMEDVFQRLPWPRMMHTDHYSITAHAHRTKNPTPLFARITQMITETPNRIDSWQPHRFSTIAYSDLGWICAPWGKFWFARSWWIGTHSRASMSKCLVADGIQSDLVHTIASSTIFYSQNAPRDINNQYYFTTYEQRNQFLEEQAWYWISTRIVKLSRVIRIIIHLDESNNSILDAKRQKQTNKQSSLQQWTHRRQIMSAYYVLLWMNDLHPPKRHLLVLSCKMTSKKKVSGFCSSTPSSNDSWQHLGEKATTKHGTAPTL